MERRIKYFTTKELRSLFNVIEKDESKYAVRNEAIFKIAYYCALRVSEIGLLELEDFNDIKNELYCKRLKGSNNNTIRIENKDVLRAFRRYLRKREGKSSYIFLSRVGKPISRKTLDRYMKEYCEKAGIKDKTKWRFHTLKHTRAIDLAECGCDLKDIQYWLGHKEISNTQIYFEYTTQQQERLYSILNGK